MSAALDELYLAWLYESIADSRVTNPSRTYWKLARHLYSKEFLWIILNDDNRCEDGLQLRVEFSEDRGLDIEDTHWLGLGCSMLEMLIGLSRRLSFLESGEPREWFWQLIDNLDICFADRGRYPRQRVEEVLDTVIFRTYDRDGSGGLFPLRHARRDQRDEELWYQLNSYILER